MTIFQRNVRQRVAHISLYKLANLGSHIVMHEFAIDSHETLHIYLSHTHTLKKSCINVSFVAFVLRLESKKEEKEKSKKEKKEKSKKRDSKDLDSHVANDTNVAEIEVGGQEDSASPKTKKKFGIFRVSGRKSKSDKRSSKHGSSDSLKRRSVDSADFESVGSEMSLEESTGSAEMSTTITEVSSIGAEVSKTITEVPTASAQELSTSVEVVEEGNEIVEHQSNGEVSNEIEGQEALVEETSSEVKVVNAVLQDVPQNEEIEKPLNQDTKLATDTLKVESVSSQDQSPVSSEVETFHFKLQSSVISIKDNQNVEGNAEQNSRTDESRAESVQMVIEEDTSTYPKKNFAVAPEVSLENIKSERDREITSSEESLDTVVSTEALNTRSVGEMSGAVEIGMRSIIGVEEPVISTYQERKGPSHDAAQELPPIDEDGIILTYENKTQNEISEEQHVQEEPIALSSKEKREDLLLSEITLREETVTETEPQLLIKNEDKMKTDEVHGEAQVEEPSEAQMEEPFEEQMGELSEEEPLIPTYVQNKRDNTEDEEEGRGEQGEVQEASVNEEAMVFSYPGKDEHQIQNEGQDGPKMDEEEPVVLEIDENKENQIQEQIQEFLKLDASIDENSAQKSEAVKKDYEVDGISTRATPKENELPKTKKIINEHSEKFRDESSPFDKKSTFSTSTPKKEPVDSEQGARDDAENIKQKTTPLVSYNVTRFKQESVLQFHFKVQMGNNIKDVKLSTKVLMAQLAEINKKLRVLQKELLAVQKCDGDKNPTKSTQMVSVET